MTMRQIGDLSHQCGLKRDGWPRPSSELALTWQVNWGGAEGRQEGEPIEGPFPSRPRVLAAERRRGEGVRSLHVGLHPSSLT